jgi:hypothetical protein
LLARPKIHKINFLFCEFYKKYKKENLERAMGYTDGDKNYIPNSKKPTVTEPYYGEWARYEVWYFENRKFLFAF